MKTIYFTTVHKMLLSKYKNAVCVYIFLLSSMFCYSQTTLVAEITGNPPDITNWTATNIDIEGEEVVLTNALGGQSGAIFFSQPYNLNQCEKWRVEFDFRIFDGVGDDTADGLAFWYLENPPTDLELGGALGMPADGNGLKVCFDTYNNDSPMGNINPELQVYYGQGYNETFPEPNMLKQYVPGLRSNVYQHAEISWDAGSIEIVIDDVVVLTGTPQPFNQAENILQGYFGFSASTGLYFDRHSIKNVQVFIDAIQLENDYAQIEICDQDGDGFEQFDLTSVENIFSDTGNFSYYNDETDAALEENALLAETISSYTNSEAYSNETIFVRLENDAGCYVIGEIELVLNTPPNIETSLVNIPGSCDSDHNGFEAYDLTQTEPQFLADPSSTQFLYFESFSAAEVGDPATAIVDPENFTVPAGATETVFVKIGEECFSIGAITLATFSTPEIVSTTQLMSCDNSSGSFEFDLSQNIDWILGNQNPNNSNISFYNSETDAVSGTNAIANITDYQRASFGCETIYVRMENSNQPQCFETSSFEICAGETSAGPPSNLTACAPGNGLAVFNLQQNDAPVLGNQDPTLINISYYTLLANAEAGENPIVTPSGFQAQDQVQTIYVRVENMYNENCYEIVSFEIESIQSNIIELESLKECSAVDSAQFDLTTAEINLDQGQEITGFFNSENDAYTNENAIDDPTSFTATNEQVIFVRVEDDGETCFTFYKFPLLIESCEPLIPEGFSPNGDGINDLFEIVGLHENYPDFNLKVFSRYGIMVYNGDSKKDFWNGDSESGTSLAAGTYFYVLALNKTGSGVLKGWVYLNR